jgi:hypothetical protein
MLLNLCTATPVGKVAELWLVREKGSDTAVGLVCATRAMCTHSKLNSKNRMLVFFIVIEV